MEGGIMSCGQRLGKGDLNCGARFQVGFMFKSGINQHLATSRLQEHIKIIHRNNTQFECSQCDRTFIALNSLLQHMKTKHEDDFWKLLGHQENKQPPETEDMIKLRAERLQTRVKDLTKAQIDLLGSEALYHRINRNLESDKFEPLFAQDQFSLFK